MQPKSNSNAVAVEHKNRQSQSKAQIDYEEVVSTIWSVTVSTVDNNQ